MCISNTHSFKVTSSFQFTSLNLTIFSIWCSSVFIEGVAVCVFVCLLVSGWVGGDFLVVRWDKGVENEVV